MSKKQIVQDMLWKYSDTTIEIQGEKPIDFETHLICYSLFEFNNIGEQLTQPSDSFCIFNFGDVSNVSLGVQEALKTMKVGEQALFEINQFYKYSEQQVLYQVELQEKLNKPSKNHFWLIKVENSFPNCLSNCCDFLLLKETINQIRTYTSQLFGLMHYNQCITLYNIITTINVVNFPGQEEGEELNIEISKSFSNQAICYSKLKDWLLMLEMCLKAISYNVKNEKAQFLLGKANFELGKKQEAEEQFKNYKKNFPAADHKEVNHYLLKCQSDFEKNEENKIQQFYSNRKNEIDYDDIFDD